MAKFRSGDLVLTSTQRIIQGTNTILDATGVANFTSLEFDTGATISEFSIDPALTDDSDSKVSTQKAVRSYVDSQISGTVPTGTDESVVRYNGLNSVQDSLLFIDDSGNVTGVNDLIAGGTGDFEGHVAIGNDSVIHDRIVLRVQEDINNDTGAVGINVNVDNASNNAAAITTAISISMINSSTSHNILAGESIYVASSNNSGATVTEVKGVDITAGVTGDNTTIATMIGGEFNILSGFSMVNTQITDAIAGKFQLLNLGSGGISITNGYGVLIKTPGFNPSGTTDNLYGLYIEDQSTVGFTTDYNLYSAGVNSRNKIEGILEVESIDTTALVISGDIYCDELFTSGSTINVGTGQIKSTAGNIELYNAGIKTLSTGVDEIQIDSSLYPGNYTTITSNINGVYYRTGGNDATSHLHRFYGNDNTGPPGAQTLLMQMNWSGGAQLYFRGVQSVSTTVSGITTRGSGGDVVAWVTDANGNGIIAPSSPSTGVIIKTRTSAPGAAIAAQFLPEAAVELYYDGTKTFETGTIGATFWSTSGIERNFSFRESGGNWTMINNWNAKGLTFVVKNADIEYTGINIEGGTQGRTSLYRNNVISVTTMSYGLTFGTNGVGPEIYKSGNNLYIDNQIHGGQIQLHAEDTATGADKTLAIFNPDGAAELYFNGAKQFETYHTGTHAGVKISNGGAGYVAVLSNGGGGTDQYLQFSSTGTMDLRYVGDERILTSTKDGEVALYYNGVKKFETTLTGATITGDLAVSQVTGLDAPAALGEAIRQTANVTEVNLNILTGGGETTLHSHASVGDAAADVTFENLDANGDVGAGATQVSIGTHTHTGLPHSGLNDDQPTKHRLINDAGTSLTELWSASKINSVAGGAITTTTTSFADGAIAINTADTEILTGAITTIGGNVVISCNTGFYTPGTETEAEVTLKLYRDTTIIRTVLVGSSRGSDAIFDILRNNSSLIIIDNPGAGTYTYRLKAIRTGDAAIAAYRAMWIVELN